MTHERQEKEVRKRIKEDIKNELNPLYSISIGSWYSEKEMLEDVSQLMIAENDVGFQAGKSQAIQEVKKLLDEFKSKLEQASNINITAELLNRAMETNFDKQKIIRVICQARISLLNEIIAKLEEKQK